jgi:ribosome-associated translation inhibitor RaiA
MQIQVNTDDHVAGREAFVRRVQAEVEDSLGHLSDQLTRVEVHLSDENSRKSGGNDKRCLMEARLAGLPPVAVSNTAASLDLAFSGAADKLKRSLESTLGRLRGSKGGDSIRGPGTDAETPGGENPPRGTGGS